MMLSRWSTGELVDGRYRDDAAQDQVAMAWVGTILCASGVKTGCSVEVG